MFCLIWYGLVTSDFTSRIFKNLLTPSQCKNFKFYSLQGKMSKVFLFLSIARAKFFGFYLLSGRGTCIPAPPTPPPPPPPAILWRSCNCLNIDLNLVKQQKAIALLLQVHVHPAKAKIILRLKSCSLSVRQITEKLSAIYMDATFPVKHWLLKILATIVTTCRREMCIS